MLAAAVGVSESSVGRIWVDAGLKPHRFTFFKLSNYPHFEEKLDDIIGLYRNPPGTPWCFPATRKPSSDFGPRTAGFAPEEGPRTNAKIDTGIKNGSSF